MLYIIGFTSRGIDAGRKIKNKINCDALLFQKTGKEVEDAIPVKKSLQQWTKEAFLNADVILYIGACGIAVRSIAPFLQDKWQDPAVLVMDEASKNCISLLSGHVGGGNAWCQKIAEIAGANPVITTATDVNGKFAVDIFAVENELYIENKGLLKEVSARILSGEVIPVVAEDSLFTKRAREEIRGKIKSRLNKCGIDFSFLCDYSNEPKPMGIYIGAGFPQALPFEKILHLCPKSLVLGIGCKRDTKESLLEEVVDGFCRDNHLFWQSVIGIASIDLKKEEPGLICFSRKRNLPFVTYSAKELGEIPGEFHGSDFVKQVAGVDNVCERSALKYALDYGKQAEIFIEKQSKAGVTLAAAVILKEGMEWGNYM